MHFQKQLTDLIDVMSVLDYIAAQHDKVAMYSRQSLLARHGACLIGHNH